jgi:hypothetical protein
MARAVRWAVGALVVALVGCEARDAVGPADLQRIAGRYQLQQVDGSSVPCCATTDSAGVRVSVLGGLLTLGDAAPEQYVGTPAGVPMARSCVHEIPNGATVDGRTGVVTLQDGTTYRIPPCGDGDYTMIVTRRYQNAGVSWVAAETTVARYTWGHEAAGGGILSLLGGGPATALGHVSWSVAGVELTMDMGVRVGPFPPLGPRYTFFRATH